MTFRDQIENNKEKIIIFLKGRGKSFTRDIHNYYGGQKEMPAVRKALNELRKEGKIETDDHVHFWRGKNWKLVHNPQTPHTNE